MAFIIISMLFKPFNKHNTGIFLEVNKSRNYLDNLGMSSVTIVLPPTALPVVCNQEKMYTAMTSESKIRTSQGEMVLK